MVNQTFKQFDVRTNILSGDWLVGYREDGSRELKTTFSNLSQNLSSNYQQFLGENFIANNINPIDANVLVDQNLKLKYAAIPIRSVQMNIGRPHGVLALSGRVYVSSAAGQGLAIYNDPLNDLNNTTNIPLTAPSYIGYLAYDQQANRIYIPTGVGIYSLNPDNNTVVKISDVTVPLNNALGFWNNHIYASQGGTLYKINRDGNTVSTINLGPGLIHNIIPSADNSVLIVTLIITANAIARVFSDDTFTITNLPDNWGNGITDDGACVGNRFYFGLEFSSPNSPTVGYFNLIDQTFTSVTSGFNCYFVTADPQGKNIYAGALDTKILKHNIASNTNYWYGMSGITPYAYESSSNTFLYYNGYLPNELVFVNNRIFSTTWALTGDAVPPRFSELVFKDVIAGETPKNVNWTASLTSTTELPILNKPSFTGVTFAASAFNVSTVLGEEIASSNSLITLSLSSTSGGPVPIDIYGITGTYYRANTANWFGAPSTNPNNALLYSRYVNINNPDIFFFNTPISTFQNRWSLTNSTSALFTTTILAPGVPNRERPVTDSSRWVSLSADTLQHVTLVLSYSGNSTWISNNYNTKNNRVRLPDASGTVTLNETLSSLLPGLAPKFWIRTSGSGGQVAALSMDTLTWYPVQDGFSFGDFCRDSSPIFYNGEWVTIYTCAFNSDKAEFGLARSTNLSTWTPYRVSVLGPEITPYTPNNTWAPEWFVDNGNYYVFLRQSTTPGQNYGAPGQGYIRCLNPGTWTQWTNFAKVSGLSVTANDPYIIKRGDKYHLFICADSAGGANTADIVMRTSNSPFSGWSSTAVNLTSAMRAALWPGNGSAFFEGPSVVHMGDDWYRAFVNDGLINFQYAIDSFDGMKTWNQAIDKPLKYITPVYSIGPILSASGASHGTVITGTPEQYIALFASTKNQNGTVYQSVCAVPQIYQGNTATVYASAYPHNGKATLCVKFKTGNPVVLATEP